MAEILSTAVSALMAFRRTLDVTSHNVANVGTDGYSRQRADFSTRQAQQYGNGFVGSGVQVDTIRRVVDEFVALQLRGSTSEFERLDTLATGAERLNNLFADDTTGLASSLQRFANAFHDVSSSPTSIPARQVLLSEANALVARLKDYDGRIAAMDKEVGARLANGAVEISTLARSIADLNAAIVQRTAQSGQPPNDLLDQRDHLIGELSKRVSVSTVPQDDGALNVFIGTGQPLVLGSEAATLTTVQNPFDASRVGLALRTPAGLVDITQSLQGGSIGGIIEFRSTLLDPARNSIGQLSAGLVDVVNGQHVAGMDLRGRMGEPLFAIGGVAVLPHSGNAVGASVNVARDDVGEITTTDYELSFDGTDWTLKRLDGQSVTMTGTGTGLDPFKADGLSIEVSGATAGDRFMLRPTRAAVLGLGVQIADPAKIAAALPVKAEAGTSNAGTGQPGALTILDPTDAALPNQAVITFSDATTCSINGGPSITWAPGDAIVANGWSLTLGGNPAAGDTFTVSANTNGVGDNRNALALASAMQQPVLEGGTASLDAAVGRFVAGIGVQTRQSQLGRDAQQVIQRDAFAQREAVSGVNLDEEAANLLRYQQAYQAAAQVIRVADSVFQSLLMAVQR
jgi:flagellar hook-associated protein 1 FlgK